MKSRLLTILLAAILTGFSIWGTLQLKMELIPNIELPFTTVMTIYPNASPEQVAEDISTPIDQLVWDEWQDKGLRHVFSTSADGISVMFAEFDYGLSMSDINKELEEKIKTLDLPEEVRLFPQSYPQIDENPRVIPLNLDEMMPLVLVTLSSSKNGNDGLTINQLRDIAETQVIPALETIDGVYKVELEAADKEQVLIGPDPVKMSENGISMSQIAAMILGSSELEIPEFNTLEDIDNIPIVMDTLDLGDFADVSIGAPPGTAITKTNGDNSIAIVVSKEPDANTVDAANVVAEEIEAIQASLQADYGDDINLTTILDQSEYIEHSIGRLAQMAIIGFALAAIVVFAFLMVFRASVITAMSIPLSIVIGFLVMHFTNVTINMLTLSAMAIAVGRLIDNSIVIVEVIYRRLQHGETVTDAAINGAKEVATPITSSTIATVAIFIPIIFVGGIISEFFLPFGLTMTYALLASLFVALMIVPAFSNFFISKRGIRKNGDKDEVKETWYQRIYLSTLKWTLANRWKTVIGAIGTLFISVVLLGLFVGTSFLPQMSEKMITVQIEMPPGSDLATTSHITSQVEDLIDQNVSDIENYYTTIGTSMSMFGAFQTAMGGGDNTSEITIMLKARADLEGERSNLEEATNNLKEQIPGSFIRVTAGDSGMAGFSSIDLSIEGDNEEDIAYATAILQDRLNEIEGLANIESQVTMVVPKLLIEQDAEKIAELELTQDQQLQLSSELLFLKVGGNVHAMPNSQATSGDLDIPETMGNESSLESPEIGLTGNATVPNGSIPFAEVNVDGENYLLFLKEIATAAYQSDDAAGITSSISIGFPQFATLGDIAKVQLIEGPTHIGRIDLRTSANIRGAITEDDVGAVNLLVKNEIDKLEDELEAEGREVEINDYGAAEQMAEMFSSMGIAIIVAMILAYLIVVISMRSFLNPIIIMASLPLASIGAVLGLLISGYTLGMSGMMGMLMLVGIVLTNAIVLIDLVEKTRKDGRDIHESLIYAGKTRLRPILMTALTTMIAMVPLALGVGEGGIIAAELAVVVIGGLFSSTLLTIIVIPVIYSLVDGLRRRVVGAR